MSYRNAQHIYYINEGDTPQKALEDKPKQGRYDCGELRSEYDQSLNDRAAMSFDHTGRSLINTLKNLQQEHKSEVVFKTDRARSDNTGDWAITKAGKGKLIIEDFSSFVGS